MPRSVFTLHHNLEPALFFACYYGKRGSAQSNWTCAPADEKQDRMRRVAASAVACVCIFERAQLRATEIGDFDNRAIWGLPANGGAGLTLNTSLAAEKCIHAPWKVV
eukprot:1082080-Prymnesium_polylepis.1